MEDRGLEPLTFWMPFRSEQANSPETPPKPRFSAERETGGSLLGLAGKGAAEQTLCQQLPAARHVVR